MKAVADIQRALADITLYLDLQDTRGPNACRRQLIDERIQEVENALSDIRRKNRLSSPIISLVQTK